MCICVCACVCIPTYQARSNELSHYYGVTVRDRFWRVNFGKSDQIACQSRRFVDVSSLIVFCIKFNIL